MRESYLTEPTKKSTFYDNYGPSGKWTKAAKGVSKLTSFFSSKNKEITENETDDDIEETFMGNDEWDFKEMELKIEELKEELKSSQYKMSVIEYNKKRAIFEMLKRINKENGKGLIKASIEAAELVFINSCPYKARCIRV